MTLPGTEAHAEHEPAAVEAPARRRLAMPAGRLETRVGLAAALSFLVVLGVAFSRRGWLFGAKAAVATSYVEGHEPAFFLAVAPPTPPPLTAAPLKPRPVTAKVSEPPVKLASHEPDELPEVPKAASRTPAVAKLADDTDLPPLERPVVPSAQAEPIAEPLPERREASMPAPAAEVLPAPAATEPRPAAVAPATPASPRSFPPIPETPTDPPAEPAREPAAVPMVAIPNAGRRNLVLADPVKPAAEPAPAASPKAGRTHVVASGENFYTISQALYGSGRYYRALHAANKAEVPKIEKLYVGTALRVPLVEDLDPDLILADDAPAASPAVAARPKARRAAPRPEPVDDPKPTRATYVVGPRDTPRTIARDTLGDAHREDEIIKLNLDRLGDDNRFAAGTRLTLPEGAKVRR